MTDLPPDQVPLAELIGCPSRRYQPAWRIYPPPAEPPPPERTEALHPNGGWYDTETGHLILRLDGDRPAPYGRDRDGSGGVKGQPRVGGEWDGLDDDEPEWPRPGDSPFSGELEDDQP